MRAWAAYCLAEAGWVAKAESVVAAMEPQRPDPCDLALEDLYRAEHRSMLGYPRHRLRLTAKQREARRLEILATAVADPALAPAFALDRLDGTRVTSEALRGKIVVIKFWYTGCEPCVRELPEFQALAHAYARRSTTMASAPR